MELGRDEEEEKHAVTRGDRECSTGGQDLPRPASEVACPEVEDGQHLWVRRRDGSWCAYCRATRFGVDISDEEREALRRERLRRGNPDVA